MAHREDIKAYLGKISVDNLRVIDWGCGTKPVTRYLKSHQNCHYVGLDKLSHVGAGIVTDITQPILLEFFDMAFCMEVLEHVKSPVDLLYNIKNNLKSGGKLVLSVPFMFQVHSPEDYWRFTDQGLALLLEQNGFKVQEMRFTENFAGLLCTAIKV